MQRRSLSVSAPLPLHSRQAPPASNRTGAGRCRRWKEGLLDDKPFYQFALGIPWGATADVTSIQAMLPLMAPGANWAAFGISRNQMPMVAQAMLMGGHVRVGLEDNLYLGYKQLASNGDLVRHAVGIVESLGGRVLNPNEARDLLGLRGTQ